MEDFSDLASFLLILFKRNIVTRKNYLSTLGGNPELVVIHLPVGKISYKLTNPLFKLYYEVKMEKLRPSQLKALSEFLNTIAAAWFSAGVISPLFIKPENLVKALILAGWRL